MIKKILLSSSFLFSLHTLSFAQNTIGPHGGDIVKNKINTFEVKIDSKANKVEVYTLRSIEKNITQNEISLTLFKDGNIGQTIDLKAVDPKSVLPHYEGEFSFRGGSFIGAELRFGFNLKSIQVLKFIPTIKNH